MAYQVFDYSIETLKNCFSNQAQAHEAIIHSKQHLVCFERYFEHINVKTIILEENYISRDFLEDYSTYYVRSFKDYKKTCVRLHFFNIRITESDFTKILEGNSTSLTVNNIQDSYVGNMVLKPLPTTIIGKTCIETYEANQKRYFPAIRKYEFNLFGIPLTVNTLAYQEQDSIVAACASSALWSVFQGTGMLFQHSIPSPVEITKWATKYFPFTNRHFPNKGLSGEQMAIAIREIGLEPYLFNVNSFDALKATVYAYLKGKIPIIFGFGLWDISDSAKPRNFGKHAVAITGYALGENISNSFNGINNLTLTSSKIDKIFVHDDQVGPFAKMEFGEFLIDNVNCLDTTWKDKQQTIGNIKATPEIIILPLYHKIRIPFEAILEAINPFNELCKAINNYNSEFPIFEWDVFLSNIKDLKGDIMNDPIITPPYKRGLLIRDFPKYLWRAIALINGEKKLEFVFDATDIDQGSFFHTTIVFNTSVESQFQIITPYIDTNKIDNLTTKAMLDSFKPS